jgi:hypothetical protein
VRLTEGRLPISLRHCIMDSQQASKTSVPLKASKTFKERLKCIPPPVYMKLALLELRKLF